MFLNIDKPNELFYTGNVEVCSGIRNVDISTFWIKQITLKKLIKIVEFYIILWLSIVNIQQNMEILSIFKCPLNFLKCNICWCSKKKIVILKVCPKAIISFSHKKNCLV